MLKKVLGRGIRSVLKTAFPEVLPFLKPFSKTPVGKELHSIATRISPHDDEGLGTAATSGQNRCQPSEDSWGFYSYLPYKAVDFPDWKGVQEAGSFSNTINYYSTFLTLLESASNINVVPVLELDTLAQSEKVRVAIRVDVDSQPEISISLARVAAAIGLPSSIYLLHTAQYYGMRKGSHFIRRPELAGLVDQLLVTGAEVGLHTDPYHIYRNWGMDGAEAVCREIDWLRTRGAPVKSTAAHNSQPAYGASNFEIFKERTSWQRSLLTPEGLELPLGVLSEEELGLTCEACFARPRKEIDPVAAMEFCSGKPAPNVRSQEWMAKFLLDNPLVNYDVDCQLWLVDSDTWVFTGTTSNSEKECKVLRLNQLGDLFSSLEPGSKLLAVIHPDYFCS